MMRSSTTAPSGRCRRRSSRRSAGRTESKPCGAGPISGRSRRAEWTSSRRPGSPERRQSSSRPATGGRSTSTASPDSGRCRPSSTPERPKARSTWSGRRGSRVSSGKSRRWPYERPGGRYPVSLMPVGSFEKALRFGEGRRLKRLAEQAAYIGTLEPEFQALSDDELRAKTAEFRQRLENGESLEEVLFEAFAAVREARVRESDQRIFD